MLVRRILEHVAGPRFIEPLSHTKIKDLVHFIDRRDIIKCKKEALYFQCPNVPFKTLEPLLFTGVSVSEQEVQRNIRQEARIYDRAKIIDKEERRCTVA